MLTSLGLSLALHAAGLVALSLVEVRGEAGVGSLSDLGVNQAFEWPSAAQVPPPAPPELPEPQAQPPLLAIVPPPPVLLEEPEEPLGIDEGDEKAQAWKGAKVATENLAPKSKVDQAALAIEPRAGEKVAGEEATNAPQGEQASKPVPAEPERITQPQSPEPSVPQPEKQQPAPVQPAEKQELPEQPEAQQTAPQQPDPRQPMPIEPGTPQDTPAEVELPRPQEKPEQLEEQQPEPEQPKEQQTRPQQPLDQQPLDQQLEKQQPAPQLPGEQPPAREQQPPSPPAPAVPASSAAPGVARPTTSEARPGLKAQEESPAASIEGSMTFKPGEPLAGKGLRVFTVTPKYSITTRMVARPKNAVVLITFGRDGKVKRAELKESTGYSDVDKPLLEAVYRWTARGDALSKIPADNPAAGVTYAIKFLMETY